MYFPITYFANFMELALGQHNYVAGWLFVVSAGSPR